MLRRLLGALADADLQELTLSQPAVLLAVRMACNSTFNGQLPRVGRRMCQQMVPELRASWRPPLGEDIEPAAAKETPAAPGLQFLNPRAANKKDADTVRSLVYRTYFGGKEHWSALLYAMVWSAPDCRTLSTRKLQAAVMAVPFFSKVYAAARPALLRLLNLRGGNTAPLPRDMVFLGSTPRQPLQEAVEATFQMVLDKRLTQAQFMFITDRDQSILLPKASVSGYVKHCRLPQLLETQSVLHRLRPHLVEHWLSDACHGLEVCRGPAGVPAKPTVEELTGDDVLLPEELDMLVTGGLYFALANGLTAAAHQRLSRLTSAPPVGRQVMVLRRSSLLAAYRACCASAPVNHAGRQQLAGQHGAPLPLPAGSMAGTVALTAMSLDVAQWLLGPAAAASLAPDIPSSKHRNVVVDAGPAPITLVAVDGSRRVEAAVHISVGMRLADVVQPLACWADVLLDKGPAALLQALVGVQLPFRAATLQQLANYKIVAAVVSSGSGVETQLSVGTKVTLRSCLTALTRSKRLGQVTGLQLTVERGVTAKDSCVPSFLRPQLQQQQPPQAVVLPPAAPPGGGAAPAEPAPAPPLAAGAPPHQQAAPAGPAAPASAHQPAAAAASQQESQNLTDVLKAAAEVQEMMNYLRQRAGRPPMQLVLAAGSLSSGMAEAAQAALWQLLLAEMRAVQNSDPRKRVESCVRALRCAVDLLFTAAKVAPTATRIMIQDVAKMMEAAGCSICVQHMRRMEQDEAVCSMPGCNTRAPAWRDVVEQGRLNQRGAMIQWERGLRTYNAGAGFGERSKKGNTFFLAREVLELSGLVLTLGKNWKADNSPAWNLGGPATTQQVAAAVWCALCSIFPAAPGAA